MVGSGRKLSPAPKSSVLLFRRKYSAPMINRTVAHLDAGSDISYSRIGVEQDGNRDVPKNAHRGRSTIRRVRCFQGSGRTPVLTDAHEAKHNTLTTMSMGHILCLRPTRPISPRIDSGSPRWQCTVERLPHVSGLGRPGTSLRKAGPSGTPPDCIASACSPAPCKLGPKATAVSYWAGVIAAIAGVTRA